VLVFNCQYILCSNSCGNFLFSWCHLVTSCDILCHLVTSCVILCHLLFFFWCCMMSYCALLLYIMFINILYHLKSILLHLILSYPTVSYYILPYLISTRTVSLGICVSMLHPGFNKTDMTKKYEAIWEIEGPSVCPSFNCFGDYWFCYFFLRCGIHVVIYSLNNCVNNRVVDCVIYSMIVFSFVLPFIF
jgi:hypothetical protein